MPCSTTQGKVHADQVGPVLLRQHTFSITSSSSRNVYTYFAFLWLLRILLNYFTHAQTHTQNKQNACTHIHTCTQSITSPHARSNRSPSRICRIHSWEKNQEWMWLALEMQRLAVHGEASFSKLDLSATNAGRADGVACPPPAQLVG